MVEFSPPERSHPWEGELSSVNLILHHVKQGNRPTIDPEKLTRFPENRQDLWLSLMQSCWSQSLESRPSMNEVCEHLSFFSSADRKINSKDSIINMSTDELLSGIDIDHVVLDAHQGTVTEIAGNVAALACENNEDIIHFQQDLEACVDKLDGTNACPFLAIRMQNQLLLQTKKN